MLAELHPQIWWYLARASGFVAWGLSVGAILLGLALATRALGDRPRPVWLLDLHRFVGGLTVALVVVHLSALVADSYATFDLADLLIPYASAWKPGPVAWGVVAMWLLVAVEVTSLVMRRLPRRLWRAIHLTSYLVGVLSTVHAYTAGTDARNPVFVGSAVAAMSATVFFLVFRLLLPKRKLRAASTAAAKARVAANARAAEAVPASPQR